MTDTSVSLLERLKYAERDGPDWRRMHDIYTPLVRKWIRRAPGLGHEADDLAQDVLVVVVREIARFERQREGSFRAWLRQITINRCRSHMKRRNRQFGKGARLNAAEEFLDQLEDPTGDLAIQWDRQHDEHVFRTLLKLIKADFTPVTWSAFRRFALDGEPASHVAADLKISENSVFLAKSRVLKRLRTEAAGLID